MDRRQILTYEQAEKKHKKQSRVLIAIGCVLIVLSVFGIVVSASGTRLRLSTRQALLMGVKETFVQRTAEDADIQSAATDIEAFMDAMGDICADARRQTLLNRRAQCVSEAGGVEVITEKGRYSSLTKEIAQWDTELTTLKEELSRAFQAMDTDAFSAAVTDALNARADAREKYEALSETAKTRASEQSAAKKALTKGQKASSGLTEDQVRALQNAYDEAANAYNAATAEKDDAYQTYLSAKDGCTRALNHALEALPRLSVMENCALVFSAAPLWIALLILGVELIVNGAVCLRVPRIVPMSLLADLLIYDFFIALAAVMLSPLLYVAIGSFSSTGLAQFRFGSFDLSAYKMIAFSQRTMRSIGNSFLITVAGTLMNITVTAVTAYALSKKDLPGRGWMMRLIVVFMLFHAGLIPDYILVANTLKLTNTYWAIWLPVLISASNLIIMKNFYQQLPESIEESARIDGCNDIQSFFHIVLPMSMASIATFSLFYAVGHWNNYQRAMIYITDNNKYPITVLLRQVVILSQGSLADDILPEVQIWAPTNAVKYATIMVGTVPIICVYPFLQKHFTKGVLMGSVKG